MINSGLAIYPLSNLVSNIGFDEFATHTQLRPKLEKTAVLDERLNYFFRVPFVNHFLDWINFKRAFKNKKTSIFSITAIIRYCVSRF